MPKKRTPAPPQPTLFDLEQFTVISAAVDPSWDECDRDTVESAPEQYEQELKIGDRFRSYTIGGHLYTLVNIRPGKPKPYTFQADCDGSKFSCLHWDRELELLRSHCDRNEIAPEHSLNLEATDTRDDLQPYNCVREQVNEDTRNTVREQKPDTQQVAPEHTHWVEEYWVQRGEKKHKYYRYCWMEGRKIQRCHIGGGNVRSPIAQARKAAVESAIAAGKSPVEIEKIIKSGVGSRE